MLYYVELDITYKIFQVCINTTCVLDRDMNVVGSAIYLAGSSLNHSCDPNSCCIFYGNSLHVRNVVDMPNFKWDNVSKIVTVITKINNMFDIFYIIAYNLICKMFIVPAIRYKLC